VLDVDYQLVSGGFESISTGSSVDFSK